MKTLNIIIIAVMSLLPMITFSQGSATGVAPNYIEGKILFSKSKEPAVYAHVFNKSKGYGTISNTQGYFRLSIKDYSDTIVITYVGCMKKQLQLGRENHFYMVFLKESPQMLSAAKIVAGDELYLYDLVLDCKRSSSKGSLRTKAFFDLKSFIDDKQVELVGCFYNGLISGYDIHDLDLKNGRIALQPFNNRLFVSLESSRAITLMKLFVRNEYFPLSPLELTKKKLKENFRLKLSTKYLDENNDSIFVLDYWAKDPVPGYHFYGQIWINHTKRNILKITQKCLEAVKYPFLPLFPSDSIVNVDIEITKSFQEINGNMFFRHIDFTYRIAYRSRDNLLYSVTTNAILYAYDINKTFPFPKYPLPDSESSDYLKIISMPYNDFFWKYNEELKLSDQLNVNEKFFNSEYSFTNNTSFINSQVIEKGLAEHPCIVWSEGRIKDENIKSYFSGNPDLLQHSCPALIDQPQDFVSDKYRMSVKLYLDVNQFTDTFNFKTATIFDPNESFYNLPVDNNALVFINIYFDLIEIERRKLEAEIMKSDRNSGKISKLYEDCMKKMNTLTMEYFRECERGGNQAAMSKWNKYVIDNLGIDNVELMKL